ncbi:MAG: hypothetical protein ACFFC7_34715, partial [Candidatus Hermodarchaeota archaeon]
AEKIGSILIYLSRIDKTLNKKPLVIKYSANGKDWQIGREILDDKPESPYPMIFEEGIVARYIVIQSLSSCRLSIDEVEIYSSIFME